MTDRTSAARRFAVHHNEEVKRTIEKTTAGGEEAVHRIEAAMEDVYSRTAQGIELYREALAIAQANVDAAFDCARELAGVTSPSAFIEVYTKHARQQLQAMTQQTKELAELAQKTAIESMGPFTGGFGALLGRPDLS